MGVSRYHLRMRIIHPSYSAVYMMASASPSLGRRDGKLESFLSKTLPGEDYERLLARQAAVVVVSGPRAAGKPAHRHAILGHRRLYLTEVPPKSLRETVELKHVQSVQIVRPYSCEMTAILQPVFCIVVSAPPTACALHNAP